MTQAGAPFYEIADSTIVWFFTLIVFAAVVYTAGSFFGHGGRGGSDRPTYPKPPPAPKPQIAVKETFLDRYIRYSKDFEQ